MLTYLSSSVFHLAKVCIGVFATISIRFVCRKATFDINSGRRGGCLKEVYTSRWVCVHLVINRLNAVMYQFAGYYTDEESFLKRVEDDANTFRPPGQLIYSYTRPTPNTASKGKRKRSGTGQDLNPANDEVIEFEVYHVCLLFHYR